MSKHRLYERAPFLFWDDVLFLLIVCLACIAVAALCKAGICWLKGFPRPAWASITIQLMSIAGFVIMIRTIISMWRKW